MDQNPQDHLDQLLNNQSDTNFQTTNEIYWNDQSKPFNSTTTCYFIEY